MNHIKGLDTLRAFAVFFVFVEHIGVWFDDTVPNGRFIKQVIFPGGGPSVYLFFVLSGFLITSILLKEKASARGNDRFAVLKNFYVRRALRIFPIYYLLYFVLISVDYHQLGEYKLYYLTYTVNFLCYRLNGWTDFSHTWTLCIEEQFYLLWPFFVLFTPGKYLKYLFTAAIICGVVTTWFSNKNGHIAPFMVWNCIDGFAIGGLYAWMRTNELYAATFEKIMRWMAIPLLLVYGYWNVSAFLQSEHIIGMELYKFVISLISVWLIAAIIKNRSAGVKKYFLENRFLNFFGKISYGIYLYHYVYIGYWLPRVYNFIDWHTRSVPKIHDFVVDRHFMYWVHFGIIVTVSWLSFVLVEKPIMRLKKFFSYNNPGNAALQ